MSPRLAALLVALVLAALACWAVPAASVRSLIAAFARAKRTVRNYRGIDVPLGLGAVWFVWALAAAAVAAIAPMLAADSNAAAAIAQAAEVAVEILLPAGVAVVAVAGLSDDLFGEPADRGLRGHFRALREGRVTTGLVKLVAIALMAAWASLPVIASARTVPWAALPSPVTFLAATALIAATTNLHNLLDLRPGRALKAGIGLTALALPALAFSLPMLSGTPRPAGWEVALVVGVAAIGPMLAVLPSDLAERSMLGDAGANAVGFVTGLVLAHSLSDVTLVVAAVVVVVLNLMSEQISFSAVIDRTPLLHAIDMVGRRPPDVPRHPPEYPRPLNPHDPFGDGL